ncbi:transcription initiation factor TFIID subunit 13 [Galendromus occidentalis]|uniref:Transcription initiation factor TFIID subunit 13 n=1 Tax=Galendromus occidentalis TaxID=34638 RepID=A0AAJ6VY80_9ACAR|nr:transcription initiation factor TFIID subunit 13 [Galendromus occidentalis]
MAENSASDDENAGAVVTNGVSAQVARPKRLFTRELCYMMIGLGDEREPYEETVNLLSELVIEFITDICHKALKIGHPDRIQIEDIIFLVRKDPRKYARIKDLLTMSENLKKARKAFDEVKYAV